jgi:hypothetical protein
MVPSSDGVMSSFSPASFTQNMKKFMVPTSARGHVPAIVTTRGHVPAIVTTRARDTPPVARAAVTCDEVVAEPQHLREALLGGQLLR